MKLLQTTDCVGGVWAYALQLADALAPHGVEIVLATMGPPPDASQRQEAASRENVTLVESTYQLEWMPDPWQDAAAAGGWLRSLEDEHAPDLIHLNGYAHAACGLTKKTVVVAHSDVLSWWRAVKGEPAPPTYDRYAAAVRAGLRAADAVVAPTAAVLALLRQHYGDFPAGRVIPNARRAADFPPGEKRPLVFAAGRLWDESKNLAALADVAADLPWPVELAGDATGPGGQCLDPPDVKLLGRLPPAAIAAKLAAASIYCLPARYEPFGLSILEAALAGCALVVGDIPTLREVWGEAALYVASDDRDGLRNALLSLIDNPAEQTRLARAARGRAMRYNPQVMARAYLNLYRSLLGEGPTQAGV